jgi:hypothetical protein
VKQTGNRPKPGGALHSALHGAAEGNWKWLEINEIMLQSMQMQRSTGRPVAGHQRIESERFFIWLGD